MAIIKCGDDEMITIGEVPAVGNAAPNFTVCNSEFETFNLETDFKGKSLVVFVVPCLDTSTCVACIKHFARVVDEKKCNYLVVTSDTPFALKRQAKAFPFDFKYVCSDMVLREFGTHYNIRVASGPLTSFLARSVFVINKNHIITHVDLSADISTPINYELMEQKINEIL